MHTSGAQLVAAYSKGNPKERFTLIYRNYCVFLQTINSYETGVYNRILCEKQYNRRQKGARTGCFLIQKEGRNMLITTMKPWLHMG